MAQTPPVKGTWAYGVTTVPERIENGLLKRTLDSLVLAGFPEPTIFIDGEIPSPPEWLNNYTAVHRTPKIRTMGNWVLSAWELYLRNPLAEWFGMFQDDFVTVRNLKAYLEQIEYPKSGYLNLYTFPQNEKPLQGFYESNQLGKGAVALVFSSVALRTILASEHMVKRVMDPRRGWKAVDGGIVTGFKKAGWKEFVHNPSLTQHTGIKSVMQNRQHELAKTFPGEDFDALSLLEAPSVPSNATEPETPSEPLKAHTTREEAVGRMLAPGARKPGKYREGVIQIWVTRACDKSCFGCTQGSNLRGKMTKITTEQFEQACISLKDYFGVVGVFGGSPTLHPEFDQLCEIMRKHIPKDHCGLWANSPHGHGKVCAETFSPKFSNINVHLDQAAYDEWKRDWPGCKPVGLNGDSRHSPPFVAIKDVLPEEQWWDKIIDCDINRHWSAMVGVFRGELRAWFCEVAGAQSILHQHDPSYPDTGIPVEPGWWQKPLSDFQEQVWKHCPECSVPLRGYGELSQSENGEEQTSATHKDIFIPKQSERLVQIVTDMEQLKSKDLKFTRYLQGASK